MRLKSAFLRFSGCEGRIVALESESVRIEDCRRDSAYLIHCNGIDNRLLKVLVRFLGLERREGVKVAEGVDC